MLLVAYWWRYSRAVAVARIRKQPRYPISLDQVLSETADAAYLFYDPRRTTLCSGSASGVELMSTGTTVAAEHDVQSLCLPPLLQVEEIAKFALDSFSVSQPTELKQYVEQFLGQSKVSQAPTDCPPSM